MTLKKIIDFQELGDQRGQLIALEAQKNIPFEIKRVYYILETKAGVARGFHAHKELTQVAVCLKGSCRIILDNGSIKEDILMNSPMQGILIESMVWHEMYAFSEDCVFLVLASELYEESDYIRDYEVFLKELQ